jgi:hypothetical protein
MCLGMLIDLAQEDSQAMFKDSDDANKDKDNMTKALTKSYRIRMTGIRIRIKIK